MVTCYTFVLCHSGIVIKLLLSTVIILLKQKNLLHFVPNRPKTGCWESHFPSQKNNYSICYVKHKVIGLNDWLRGRFPTDISCPRMYTCTLVCQDLQPKKKNLVTFFNFVLMVACSLCWVFPVLHINILYILPLNTYLLSSVYAQYRVELYYVLSIYLVQS